MKETQNYKNHARWFPPFHFVLAPLMLINLIYWSIRLYQEPGWDHAMLVVLGVALFILTAVARFFALKNQDRIIRLEERIRYRRILDPELFARSEDLSLAQIIALRFAEEEELGDLVAKVLDGELESVKDIKLAVRNWRADHHRV